QRLQSAPRRQVRQGGRPAGAEGRRLRTGRGRPGRRHRQARQPVRHRPRRTTGLHRTGTPHVGQYRGPRPRRRSGPARPPGGPLHRGDGRRSAAWRGVRARARCAGSRHPPRRDRGPAAAHPGQVSADRPGHDVPGVHRPGRQRCPGSVDHRLQEDAELRLLQRGRVGREKDIRRTSGFRERDRRPRQVHFPHGHQQPLEHQEADNQVQFRIKNTWSWSCSSRKVSAWLTGSISASSNWTNTNTSSFWKQRMSTVNDSKGWGSACPAGNLAFDVTAGARSAASSKWSNINIGLRADDEKDEFGWKKFDANSAVLSTEYNTIPNVPSNLDTIPSSGGCDTVAPFTTIGNTDVTLTAKVSDSDGGTVRAQFRLWGTNDLSGGSQIFNQIVSVTSGTVAKVKVPKATLQQHLAASGGNFGWKV